MSAPTILFLDDDDDLREAVTAVFGMLGRECLALPSVAAMIDTRDTALACELVILDVNLGDGLPSGVDAFAWLRDQKFGGRIVFLTGHARSDLTVARASTLSEHVLQKPLSTEELRALATDARGS